MTGPSKWLWWFAAKTTGPFRCSRGSSPFTVPRAKTRESGRIHVGRLARRTTRTRHVRLHEGKTIRADLRGARSEVRGPRSEARGPSVSDATGVELGS